MINQAKSGDKETQSSNLGEGKLLIVLYQGNNFNLLRDYDEKKFISA